MDVVLKCSTSEDVEEIALDGDKLSFGRGSEADHRFPDDGLSRLHSTIYRDGDNVWIVDENSTNGTFVNGERVPLSGTPLQNGDTVKIGNYTNIKVKFVEKQSVPSTSPANQVKSTIVSASSPTARNPATLIAVVAISVAIFFISVAAVFITIKALSKDDPVIVQNTTVDDSQTEDSVDNTNENREEKTPTPTNSPKIGNVAETPGNTSGTSTPTNSPEVGPTTTPSINLGGKKYLQLSEPEKSQYIEAKLKKIAGIIGNRASDEIPPSAVERIKRDVTAYANRLNRAKKSGGGCSLGDNLQATYERASKNAGFISRAFIQEGLDGQIGIYVAMIESEHCPCVQSGTGPLGMFQFTYATGVTFFDKGARIVKGSNPSNPDDRCNPEPAARASARYVKYLMGWYGTGPASVPLAIASYNSGEGAMRTNLKKALESDPSLSRDFWTLIANTDKLTKQFQDENFMYPPKFFASAIVGENPQDFGLNLQPLSTYMK
jgi:pSer/pThr/pTyr-binding forkhead associated (FHA) protein